VVLSHLTSFLRILKERKFEILFGSTLEIFSRLSRHPPNRKKLWELERVLSDLFDVMERVILDSDYWLDVLHFLSAICIQAPEKILISIGQRDHFISSFIFFLSHEEERISLLAATALFYIAKNKISREFLFPFLGSLSEAMEGMKGRKSGDIVSAIVLFSTSPT